MKTTTAVLTAAVALAMGAAAPGECIVLPQGSTVRYPQRPSLPIGRRAADAASMRIPLVHHSKRDLSNPDETWAFALRQREHVLARWGGKDSAAANEARAAIEKRQTIGLQDYGQDSSYYGQVSVGTPKQNFNVVLDTGSADFWLATTDCQSSDCQTATLFNPASSSSYHTGTTPFQIQYGTGAVAGTMVADDVSLAGYEINDLSWANVDQVASNTITPGSSGIMGMGFEQLATSKTTPFWQVLVEQNLLKTNVFTFQLARASTTASSSTFSPGGVFTLGLLDGAQYTGDVSYVNLVGSDGFWTIPLDAITVNGNTATLSSGNTAAIDTGTTLIAMPDSVLEQVFSQIPGAQPAQMSSSSEGFYSIPCSSNNVVSLRFGGKDYSISAQDLISGQLTFSSCLAALFSLDLGGSGPDYVVGDTFLKNVFAAFQYSPAAVGFAALKSTAGAQTVATTSGAVGAAVATQTASAAPVSSSAATATQATGVPGLPSVASSSAAAATSGGSASVVAASGLPQPSAATNTPTATVSLIPAGSSSGFSSSSAPMHIPSLLSALFAFAFAFVFAL